MIGEAGATEILLLALVGAVAFLDQWPAVQTMASRPIVVGVVAGLILGAPAEGALWGALFELAFLGGLPVGAARNPDAGLAALIGTVVGVTGAWGPDVPAGYAVASGLAAGRLGEAVGRLHRTWNGRTATRVRDRVAAGDPDAPGRGIAVALTRGAALGLAQAGMGLFLALAGLRLVGGTAWSGPLPVETLRLVAVAAGAISGLALFGVGGKRGPGWAAGIALGVVLAWVGTA